MNRSMSTRRLPIILKQDFERLGFRGEEIQVKPGYARNYLIPQRIAVYATQENKERYLIVRESVEAVEGAESKRKDLKLRSVMSKTVIEFKRQLNDAKTGMKSPVEAEHIALAVRKKFGHDAKAADVDLPSAIKEYGLYQIMLRMAGHNIGVPLQLNVIKR
eukprot:CAMPEP_0184654746 /NCGR_PEP_ID=MMETSP0308-20130426/12399_1 /TAXON_ID=38269 /ORGANISM="Gloeochaete witrockiana, Strain SAG 46.84" /LENGTH=160 /DNA_ID=CAMNT_0027090867 /DNA_START=133 /DNA_END=615 /DNA_ORIENTATION=-